MSTPRERQMSSGLFNPAIRDATNAALERHGVHLASIPADSTRKPILELRANTGEPTGLRLGTIDGSHRSLHGSLVGIQPWVEDGLPVGDATRLITAVMDAENTAHAALGGATKPTYGVEQFDLTALPSHLKGRLAATPWRQNAGWADEPPPPAEPVKALQMNSPAEFRTADGALVRVPKNGHLAIGVDGKAFTIPHDARLATLDGVDAQTPAADVTAAAERMVKGLAAVRTIHHNAPAQRVAVLEEANGKGALVSETDDGRLVTLRVMQSPQEGRNALQSYGPTYDLQAQERDAPIPVAKPAAAGHARA